MGKTFLFAIGIWACLPVFTQAEPVTDDNLYAYTLPIAEQLVKDFPRNAECYFVLGYVHQTAKQFLKAIEAYRQDLALAPNQPDIVLQVAFLYFRLHEYEQSIEWYRKALQQDPGAPRARERMGHCYTQLNRMAEARKAYEDEVKRFPDNAIAHYYLAERLFSDGDAEAAVEHASKTIQLDSRYPEPFYLLAKVYRKLGDKDKFQAMMKAFQEKKGAEESVVEDMNRMSLEEAAPILAAQIHTMAAQIYLAYRQPLEAEKHLRSAIEQYPDSIDARVSLSDLYQATRQYGKAEAVIRELLEKYPDEFNYQIGLGLILSMQKKWEEAIPILDRAYASSPNLVHAKLCLAQALMDSGIDLKRAIHLLEDAAALKPNANTFNLLSKAYYLHKDFDKSLAAMQKALQLDPQNQTIQQRLMMLKRQLGR